MSSNTDRASRTDDPSQEGAVVVALQRIVETLQRLNEKLIERDSQFDVRGAEMLAQWRWANRLHLATIVGLVGLGLLAARLLARQDSQQDRLGELANDIAAIDTRLTRVDATTESTRESVEVAASAAVQEPRVELEVRSPSARSPASSKPQLAVVIRPRRAASPSASVSVVIPIEPPASARP